MQRPYINEQPAFQAHEDEVFRLDEGRWEEIFYDDEMEDAG